MMAGLMMVFLLISVTYNLRISEQAKTLEETTRKVQDVSASYTDKKEEIYQALNNRFSHKFAEWNASLDRKTLTLTFSDPAVLFEAGSDELTSRFKEILNELWIGYVSVLNPYSEDIQEIRIEGHTSSEWSSASLDESYFNNMDLSQRRTKMTLRYCYFLTGESSRGWVRRFVTANGLSFSRAKLSAGGLEDSQMSRRVEFTVVVNSTEIIKNIEGILNDK
jgi:outer membrane protein OmpA-like peptidoglycan-associated protein